jgi:hypothetical protein
LRQRKIAVAGGKLGRVEYFSSSALEQKQAARLCGGPDEGSADAAVEAQEAVGSYGLPETIDRALVPQWQVVGLALKSDLDSVEGVLDVFADNTGNLGTC